MVILAIALLLAVDGATVALATPVSEPTDLTPASVSGTGPTTPSDSTIARQTASEPVVANSLQTVTRTAQETSSAIRYSGTWATTTYSKYLGGKAKYSRQRGASASIRFSGVGFSWIGPVGPTRGTAKIYIDGTYVKTVSTWARTFSPVRVVWSRNWSTQRARTVKIVVQGTAGHPTVAIDALRLRSLAVTEAAPPPPVGGGTIVNVSSIPALKSALADNSVDQIVVANGTYRISPSSNNASNSLWIGPAYAKRTRPITVRAATIGGVTFDGGGGSGFRALSFEAGAHDQTWDGFNFANMAAYQSGIIEIAGYTSRAAPHHITLRHITIAATCTGRATTANGGVWDHGVYLSQALYPGAHDLVFEDMIVHGEGNLATAFHFFHGADSGGYNAHNVLVRRLTVTGTQQAFLMWEPTVYNITLDTATITRAKAYAIRYETIGSRFPTGIQIRNVTSTGSGYQGFFSTAGGNPPGVSFYNNSLR